MAFTVQQGGCQKVHTVADEPRCFARYFDGKWCHVDAGLHRVDRKCDAKLKTEITLERTEQMMNDNQPVVRAYLEAVAAWNLSDAAAGDLIGVAPRAASEWQEGQPPEATEEVVARMLMTIHIRTALDICCQAPLSNQWMSLRNNGEPFQGLSPVEYVSQHGWPGLYLVLRTAQAWAVGNGI